MPFFKKGGGAKLWVALNLVKHGNYEEEDKKKEDKNENEIKDIYNKPNFDYEIIQNSEIIKKRDAIIAKFIECSCLTYDEAELVLIYYNWNYEKLIEEWYDNMDKIKIESHIEQSPESTKNINEFITKNNLTDDICPVCYTEIDKDESMSLKCNHKICNECYIEYINNKLSSEPLNILDTFCPLNGCNLYLTRTIFKKCITEKRMQRVFAKSVIRNFILTNKNIKLCPNPKCNISIKVQNNSAKEIKCQCGTVFCFSCLEESHIPCDCEMTKQWKEFTKETGSGEDFIWIKDNTKNCPKCNQPIEKNQGCNHMTCQRKAGGCGYEFCWVCMGSWNAHTITSLNSFYNCERKLDEEYKKKEKKKNLYIPGGLQKLFQGEKMDELERYITYYKKWYNYYRNLEISEKISEKIKACKKVLIEMKKMMENDLTFLDESLNTIIDCTRLLKYIYIFKYYLKDNVNITLFDNNLEILRNQTDSLLELIELDTLPGIIRIDDDKKFKEKFLKYKDRSYALIKSTQTFKNNLINEIENNLYDKINYDRIKKLNEQFKAKSTTRPKRKKYI